MYEIVHPELVFRQALAGGALRTLPVPVICSMLIPPTSVLVGRV